jgi:hypothetical protein
MILPGHKERIIQEQQKQKQPTQPELTEEEQEMIFGILQASL